MNPVSSSGELPNLRMVLGTLKLAVSVRSEGGQVNHSSNRTAGLTVPGLNTGTFWKEPCQYVLSLKVFIFRPFNSILNYLS